METKTSIDDQFLSRVHKVIEQNLDNENFSVEDLAHEVGLSRSMLHRKLIKLTGKSAGEHIVQLRLITAKKLLENHSATVSETAYRVGFRSPSYFNKVFKKHFEVSPGDFSKGISSNYIDLVDDLRLTTIAKRVRKNKYTTKKAMLWYVVLVCFCLAIYSILTLPFSSEKSIAVLPIHNLTGDPDNDYFADGVHDALIGELGQISSLRVISRTSTLRYRDSGKLMKDIAKELGTTNIIEGSVVSFGDSVRLLIQLIDVFPKERHLLSKNYQDNISGILNLQSLIAKDVARKVNVEISKNEKQQLDKTKSVNPETYKAYLRGMYYLRMGTKESFETGIDYLQKAIDNDPGDPFAYAGLALGYAHMGHGQLNAKEAFIRAKNAAYKAIKLDPTLDEAHTSLAIISLYQDWNWEEAKTAFENAIASNPNNVEAHAHFAWYHIVFKDIEKSIYHGEKAVMLEPLSASYTAWLALIYIHNQEYDKAEHWALKAIDLKKDTPYAYWALANISIHRKQYAQAIDYIENLPHKAVYWKTLRGYIYTEANQKNKALELWDEVEELAKVKSVNSCYRGMMAAYLGFTDQAFELFNEAIESKTYPIVYVGTYPCTKDIRSDSRFNDLLLKMNLPVIQ
ncbi:helix-turn-helix domain-containing protein [Labilibacter sediminis]|nr:helix-turn-helix domain-containing protein [Labilibacter sediminis]